MDKFQLNVLVEGKPVMQYMADLLVRNDKQQIEIERCRLSVRILKQMNVRSRLFIDAYKYELKVKESGEEVSLS
jgi:hypothetical protein